MYHCYLRGKQFELLAIRNSIRKITEANITSIIEPVRESQRDILKCVECLKDNQAEYILISNPTCGELVRNQLALDSLISSVIEIDENVELAYIVDENTTINQVENFINQYKNQKFCILHAGQFSNHLELIDLLSTKIKFNKHIFIEECNSNGYRNRYSAFTRVLIKDEFNKRIRNADYADHLLESFSDLFNTFRDMEYQGFGDFSIIGNHFSEGGGQAITAALHITFNAEEDIFIRHFLSEPRLMAEEVPILLEEALGKLSEFLEDNFEILEWSDSCSTLMNILQEGCQTNLAMIKKLTICHHLELMHHLTLQP